MNLRNIFSFNTRSNINNERTDPEAVSAKSIEENPMSQQAAAEIPIHLLDNARLDLTLQEEIQITESDKGKPSATEPAILWCCPDILDEIAALCPPETQESLSQLGARFSQNWVAYATVGPNFEENFGGYYTTQFWELFGGIDWHGDTTDIEFDQKLVEEINFEWELQGKQCVMFSQFVSHRKICEDSLRRGSYEEMTMWMEGHVGSIRGVYHFLRHIAKMSSADIVSMPPQELLETMATIPRQFDVFFAACFYGLNGFACTLFEEMDLSEEEFVSQWESALSGHGLYFSGGGNEFRFSKVKRMLGNDLFTYVYLHGNWKLARDISQKYGKNDPFGSKLIWRLNDNGSIFIKSLPVMLDTLDLDAWRFFKGLFSDHFVLQGNPCFALSKLFLDTTDVSRFHGMVSLLRLTGSVGVRRRVEERMNPRFGVNHLKSLDRHVFDVELLMRSMKQQFAWYEGSRCQMPPYPYDLAACNSAHRQRVLDGQMWVQVSDYLAEPGYFQKHSELHTKVFAVGMKTSS